MNSSEITSSRKPNKKRYMHEDTKIKLWYAIASIVIGIFVGIFIISIFGYSPLAFFKAIYIGNFSSLGNFTNFVSTLIWMTFIGLAMVVSFRAGVFNIGISAQMVGGGLAGYLFAALAINTGRWGVIFTILIPITFGIMIAMIIAVFKNKFGVHEVVTSIMLNWAVFWLYRYFRNPNNFKFGNDTSILYNNGTVPIDATTNNSLRFTFIPDSPLNIGLIVLLVVLPLIWFIYKYTTFGVKQSIIKSNKGVAEYSGISYENELYKAFALSGGLAGFAGACFYLGTNQSITAVSSDLPAEAFNGITIALIGFNDPLGAFIAAIFLSLFENSKQTLNAVSDSNAATIVMSLILWLLAISSYFTIVRPQDKVNKWLNENSWGFHNKSEEPFEESTSSGMVSEETINKQSDQKQMREEMKKE